MQKQRKEPFVHKQNKLPVKTDVYACQLPLDHRRHHMCLQQSMGGNKIRSYFPSISETKSTRVHLSHHCGHSVGI